MLRFVSTFFVPFGHNDYVRSHIYKCSISNFVIMRIFGQKPQEKLFICTDNEIESLTQKNCSRFSGGGFEVLSWRVELI